MTKINAKYVIGISFISGILVGLGIVWVFFREPNATKAEVMPGDTSTSSAVIAPPQPTQTSWPSPDGKKILVMKTQSVSTTQTKYSLATATSASESGDVIFSQTVDKDTHLAIPFNAWSPSDQYLFVEESSPSATRNYVFKASGEAWSDGQAYLDVNSIFETKQTKVALEKVTGWAAPTLLIVNTQTTDSKPGPSFWFDVIHKSVTRLSTSFK